MIAAFIRNHRAEFGVAGISLVVRLAIFLLAQVKMGPNSLHELVSLFNRWDAIHYLNIATYGYKPEGMEASVVAFMGRFPPLYPFFISTGEWWGLSDLSGYASLLSMGFMVVASVLLYRLMLFETKCRESGIWAVVFLNCFPVGYFANSPYSESLFLALLLGYFYLLRVKQSYWGASLAFSLSLLVRVFGIVLGPVHLFFFLFELRKNPRRLKTWVALVLPGMVFLAYEFGIRRFFQLGDYLSSQESSTIRLGLPFKELGQSWGKLLSDPAVLGHKDFMFTLGFTALFYGFFLVVTLWGWKRLPPAYFIFSSSSLLLIACLSWVISGPRFLWTVFPVFMLMAQIGDRWVKLFLALIFCFGLYHFSLVYLSGKWAF